MVPISHIHTSDITIPANTTDMKFGEIDKYLPSICKKKRYHFRGR